MTFRVRNTGTVAGSTASQVYLTLPDSAGEPSRRLVGFQRVTLRPKQSATVRVVINPAGIDRPLSVWDTKTHSWRTPAGRFLVQVGGSVTSLPLRSSFAVR